jgi:hypothetical protein
VELYHTTFSSQCMPAEVAVVVLEVPMMEQAEVQEPICPASSALTLVYKY